MSPAFPGANAPSLSHDDLMRLPIRQYEGEVVVVRQAQEVAPALARLTGEAILGFDTETRPAFRRGEKHPPALVQLAGAGCVVLFQVRHVGVPPPLVALLSAPAPVKAGVAVRDDLLALQEMAPFGPAGFVDLGDVARRAGLRVHGLRNLAAALLGFRVSKSAQTSNWGRPELEPRQIRYAATDAWVSRELCVRFADAGLLPALGGGATTARNGV